MPLLAGACSDKKDPDPSGAISDASYDAPPGRHVVEDVPDGFFNPRDATEVPPVMTGSPGVGGDGSVPLDTAGAVDVPREASAEGGAASGCDLLRQECGGGLGCYPTGDGRAACRVAGGLPENADCVQHEDCLPDLLCASGFVGTGLQCLRRCDPRNGAGCPGMRGCRPYSGSAVGTCAP